MRHLGKMALLLLLALPACEELIGPSEPFSLTVTTEVVTPGHGVLVNGALSYGCTFKFNLSTAGGASNEGAAWTTSQIDYRLTSNGTLFSRILFTEELQDWFGSNVVLSGSQRSATRGFSWTGPFTLAVSFRYVSNLGNSTQNQTTIARATCA